MRIHDLIYTVHQNQSVENTHPHTCTPGFSLPFYSLPTVIYAERGYPRDATIRHWKEAHHHYHHQMIDCTRAHRHSVDTHQYTYRFTILYICLKRGHSLIDPGMQSRYCTITVMTYCAWQQVHCLSCRRINQGIGRMSGGCIHVGKTFPSSSRSPVLVIASMWLEAPHTALLDIWWCSPPF